MPRCRIGALAHWHIGASAHRHALHVAQFDDLRDDGRRLLAGVLRLPALHFALVLDELAGRDGVRVNHVCVSKLAHLLVLEVGEDHHGAGVVHACVLQVLLLRRASVEELHEVHIVEGVPVEGRDGGGGGG
jgi:hypothetical protein